MNEITFCVDMNKFIFLVLNRLQHSTPMCRFVSINFLQEFWYIQVVEHISLEWLVYLFLFWRLFFKNISSSLL